MNFSLATTCILAGSLLAGGCATKKYVRNTTAPIQAKVDQVGEQTTQNSQQINETGTQVKQVDERAQSGISAAQERAATADTHAGEAMNRANEAAQSADQANQAAQQNSENLNQFRQAVSNVVANIDDYKLQNSAMVPFKFNRYSLDDSARGDLDKLADSAKSDKRYFIAVEGFTDTTGTKQYNEMLSRKRADAVVEYLVAQHDIPIYRIHVVGLGEAKPVDSGRNRAARAKNRRVDVKVFSADDVPQSLASTTSGNQADRSQTNVTGSNPTSDAPQPEPVK
jgi:outer membrane protein OmpA-like peptidoglycan-associated protein